MNHTYEALRNASAHDIRSSIRQSLYSSHTAGLANGLLQANLAILPEKYAPDFMRFCQRNPKPCPLVGVSDTGNPRMFTLGENIDIRTDVPKYDMYRDGQLTDTVSSIADLWTSDLVVFALGCSFTFEHAVQRAGVPIWHIDNNRTVSMFRTSVDTVPAGPFSGKMVVTMRPVPKDKIDLVTEVSRKYPYAHGAPVHWGNPEQIGIKTLDTPDWGDPCPVEDGMIPVFWACGVTPQVAIEQAKLPLCITHKPGHMLITDVDDQAEISIITSVSS